MTSRNFNLPMNVRSASSCRAGAPLANPATDPPSFNYGATSAVALQSRIAQNLCVSEFQFGGEFVWHPSPELIAQSNVQQFIEKHQLGSYDELMRRSTAEIAWFWDTV